MRRRLCRGSLVGSGGSEAVEAGVKSSGGGGGRFVPATVCGVCTGGFPRPLPARKVESRWSSGEVGVHGGCGMGTMGELAFALGALGVSGMGSLCSGGHDLS
jgi:hypothetical protein